MAASVTWSATETIIQFKFALETIHTFSLFDATQPFIESYLYWRGLCINL
jgi:hypothetical protein